MIKKLNYFISETKSICLIFILIIGMTSLNSLGQVAAPLLYGTGHTICKTSDNITIKAVGCTQNTKWNTGEIKPEISVREIGIYSAKCIENEIESPSSHDFKITNNTSGYIFSDGLNKCISKVTELYAVNIPDNTKPYFFQDSSELIQTGSYSFSPYKSGNYNFKVRKTNKGSWTQSTVFTSFKINDLLFLNQTTGFAVDSAGRVFKSINGGITWTSKLNSYSELTKIIFTDNSNGWIIGKNGRLYQTTNGGETWSRNYTISSVSNFHFLDISFINNSTGWISCSNGKIYKTTNNGLSWQIIRTETAYNNSFLHFFDFNNGLFYKSGGTLYMTIDGGTTWSVASNLAYENIVSIKFIDMQNIVYSDNRGIIKKTMNGGLNWLKAGTVSSSNTNSISSFDKFNMWLCGNNGLLGYSENQGKNWIDYTFEESINYSKIFFLNEYFGWLGSKNGKVFIFNNSDNYYCPSSDFEISDDNSVPTIVISQCEINQVTLNATGCNGIIIWNDGSNINPKLVSQNGNYSAKCSFIGGCLSRDAEIEVKNINLKPTIGLLSGTNCLSSEPTIGLTSIQANQYTFEWLKNGIALNSNLENIIPLDTGDYYLRANKILNSKTWKELNKKPPSSNFFNAQFITNRIAWSANKKGDIFKTEDGGNSWKYISFPGREFIDIKFFNSQKGIFSYIQNSTCYIQKTIDGGLTWSNYQMGEASTYVYKIFFINENVGWGVGNDQSIVKTTDGGVTWNFQRRIVGGATLDSPFFLNQDFGWVTSSDGSVLFTVNGGSQWIAFESNFSNTIADIWFQNPTDGFLLTESNGLYITKNSGSTWTKVNVLNGELSVMRKILFKNSKEGYIVGTNFFYFTSDGGNSWNYSYVPNTGGGYIGFDVIDKSHIIYAGASSITISHDNGVTWKSNIEAKEETISRVEFFNKNFGYRIRYSDVGITQDGGKHWENFKVTFPYSITKSTNNKLWLSTGRNEIYSSTDYGKSWTKNTFVEPRNYGITKVYFMDDNKGFIIGYRKLIYITKDGGNTWTLIPNGPSSSSDPILNDIYFLDENIGYISSSKGYIYKTTNGGETWIQNNTITTNSITYLKVFDTNNFIIADDLNLYRTYDGGQVYYKKSYNYQYKYSFISPEEGYAMNFISIYHSTNGGITWNSINPINPVQENYLTIHANNDYLIAAGYNSVLDKYSNEGDEICNSNKIAISEVKTPTVLSKTNIICNEIPLPISAINCEGSITWSNQSVGANIKINLTGTYFANCLKNNCVSENSNSIIITKNTNCSNISLIPNLVYVCPNEEITISAIGCQNGTIKWSNGLEGHTIIQTFTQNSILEAFCSTGGNKEIKVQVQVMDLINPEMGLMGTNIYKAQNTIILEEEFNSIDSNQKHLFYGGKSISLKPGFEFNATTLGVFNSEIKKCPE